jgi:Glycosyl hydrolases family 16
MAVKRNTFDRRALLVAGTGGLAAIVIAAVGFRRRPSWRRVFFDDFSGSELDANTWFRYSGPGNAGVGWRDPDQVVVDDGEVRIIGLGDVAGGIGHRQSQLYGKWEVRTRVDAGAGYGPAILLWPQSDEWPEHGEIDVAEIPLGARTQSHFTVHWGAENSQKGTRSTGDFSRWHVVGCEWERDSIRYLLDGEVRWELREPRSAIPSRPMYLGIQLDVGAEGHWIPGRDHTTPQPVVLHVDWVAVYQRDR